MSEPLAVREAPASYVLDKQRVRKGYKQTEVGVIPEDWDVARFGEIATPRKQRVDPKRSGIYEFCVELEHIVSGTGTLSGYASTNAQSSLKSVFRVDDVLFGKLRAYLRKYWQADREGVCSTEIWVLSPTGKLASSAYLFQIVQTDNFVEAASSSYGTHMPRSDWSVVRNYVLPLPPTKDEQEAIAEALSDADAQVEALEQLIAKKRQLKQGAMQELLTGKKRLPGFGGEWEVRPFKDICWFQEGPGVRNYQFTSSGVKLLNGTNIFRGVLNLETTSRFISEKEAYGAYAHFMADAGDIVIASSGITIERFHEKVAFVSESDLPFCMNTSTIRFKPHVGVLAPEFLYQYLTSDDFKRMIGGQATGSAQLNFGPSHVAKVMVSLPPLPEQTAIATILSDMDIEIAALGAQLAKARGIKQGMMQELLTGRIRLV